jgi:hypothetical protein
MIVFLIIGLNKVEMKEELKMVISMVNHGDISPLYVPKQNYKYNWKGKIKEYIFLICFK